MAVTVKQLVRRHGAAVSAVTAGAVGIVIVAQRIAESVIGYLSAISVLQGVSFDPDVRRTLLIAIPFAIGFFASLWIIAPIAEELGIGHVITRAILATGVGATLVFVALAVAALLGAVSFTGAIFGQSFPSAGFDGAHAVAGLSSALVGAFFTLVDQLPLGVLAGVLLWVWRKGHPPRHPLSGLIDEV